MANGRRGRPDVIPRCNSAPGLLWVRSNHNAMEITMTIEVTLRMSPAAARRLVELFHDGKLAELGILDVTPAAPSPHELPLGRWTDAEDERRQTPAAADVPRRG